MTARSMPKPLSTPIDPLLEQLDVLAERVDRLIDRVLREGAQAPRLGA